MLNAEGARVLITLNLGTNYFGTTASWEASLYSGTKPGEETEGRFTEWKSATGNVVIFNLPEDIRENFEAPWCQERNLYARIRTLEGYPVFDLVTRPLTLAGGMEIIIPLIISSPPLSYSLEQHPHL